MLILEYTGKTGKSALTLQVDERDCAACMKEFNRESKSEHNTPLKIQMFKEYVIENYQLVSKPTTMKIHYYDINGNHVYCKWNHHYVSLDTLTGKVNDPKLNIFNVPLKYYIMFIFLMLLDIPRNTPLENDVFLECVKTHFKYRMDPCEDVCRLLEKNKIWGHYNYENMSVMLFPGKYYC